MMARDLSGYTEKALWDRLRGTERMSEPCAFSLEEAAKELLRRRDRLHAKTHNEVEQTLGVALGYPLYRDDQKNFPGATKEMGVCVGEHTPETLASEASRRISELEGKLLKVLMSGSWYESALEFDTHKGVSGEGLKEEIRTLLGFNDKLIDDVIDIFATSYKIPRKWIDGTIITQNEPYLTEARVVHDRKYNPDYGDGRVCVCGHEYRRHFDPIQMMEPTGCKYCGCDTFREAPAVRDYQVLEELMKPTPSKPELLAMVSHDAELSDEIKGCHKNILDSKEHQYFRGCAGPVGEVARNAERMILAECVKYDPNYGDNTMCVCGRPYYAHFRSNGHGGFIMGHVISELPPCEQFRPTIHEIVKVQPMTRKVEGVTMCLTQNHRNRRGYAPEVVDETLGFPEGTCRKLLGLEGESNKIDKSCDCGRSQEE